MVVAQAAGHVVVATHDVQWGDGAELLDNILTADIAGMDDGFAAFKRSNGFRTEQSMGVGNHANFHADSR